MAERRNTEISAVQKNPSPWPEISISLTINDMRDGRCREFDYGTAQSVLEAYRSLARAGASEKELSEIMPHVLNFLGKDPVEGIKKAVLDAMKLAFRERLLEVALPGDAVV